MQHVFQGGICTSRAIAGLSGYYIAPSEPGRMKQARTARVPIIFECMCFLYIHDIYLFYEEHLIEDAVTLHTDEYGLRRIRTDVFEMQPDVFILNLNLLFMYYILFKFITFPL